LEREKLKSSAFHGALSSGTGSLNTTGGNPFPTPGTGKIVRIAGKHSQTVIAKGLSVPTSVTFGPDGNLYVANVGFGPPPIGLGQLLKITLPQ
jgi:sugar lactone lactonase YvrE